MKLPHTAVLLIAFLSGAQAFAEPTAFKRPSFYRSRIQPVLEARCVVCHACESAPCQLKLDSFEGLDRGAIGANPKRLGVFEAQMTRMFKDAKTTEGWRERGFWPVVSRDDTKTPKENLDASLLYRFLDIGKSRTAMGLTRVLPPRKFKRCVKNAQDFDDLMIQFENHALGMPFGAEAISDAQFEDFKTWIMLGAPGPNEDEIRDRSSVLNPRTLTEWEAFLNGPTLKHQWTAKYLYEHLYLAHFHFEDSPGQFFELIRARKGISPPDEAVTKFPYLRPNEAFEYRFRKIHSTIVHKVHIVYRIAPGATLARINDLFINTPWPNEDRLPRVDYETINPFQNFKPIPAKLRYRYLIENSRMMLDFFTRGPVCSGGSKATYVVQDHAWLFFLDPESDVTVNDADYFDSAKNVLVTPTMQKIQKPWPYYLEQTRKYEEFHAERLKAFRPHGYSEKDIWNGDGNNPNALLTLYRHAGYSVSVHQGQVGEIPKTFGLMDYATFERIYYDLVAGFNIYGGMSHKLNSRFMITHLRRELEDHYLALLPKRLRNPTRRYWYRTRNHVLKTFHYNDIATGMPAEDTVEPARDLADRLTTQVLSPAVVGRIDPINDRARALKNPGSRGQVLSPSDLLMARIAGVRGSFPRYFPEVSYIAVVGETRTDYYTVFVNRAHRTMNTLLFENWTLDPVNDTLNIRRDFPLSFPNQFFTVAERDLERMVSDVQAIHSPEEYRAFQTAYGIGKSDPRFWKFFDELVRDQARKFPVESGVLDLNRYGLHDFSDYKF